MRVHTVVHLQLVEKCYLWGRFLDQFTYLWFHSSAVRRMSSFLDLSSQLTRLQILMDVRIQGVSYYYYQRMTILVIILEHVA